MDNAGTHEPVSETQRMWLSLFKVPADEIQQMSAGDATARLIQEFASLRSETNELEDSLLMPLYQRANRGWFQHFTPSRKNHGRRVGCDESENDQPESLNDAPYWVKHMGVGRAHVVIYPSEDADEEEVVEYYVEAPQARVPEQRQAIAEAQLADAVDLLGLPPWMELRWMSLCAGDTSDRAARAAAIAETTSAFAATGIARAPTVVRHVFPRYSAAVEEDRLALAMYLETPMAIYLRAEPIPDASGTLQDYLLRQDVRHGAAFAYQALRDRAPDTGIGNRVAIEYPVLRERLDAYRVDHPNAAVALNLESPIYLSAPARRIALAPAVAHAWQDWLRQSGPRSWVVF